MSATATITANHVYFSKVCEFWFENNNCAAPMGKCGASEFAEMLNAIGGDVVRIQFSTTQDEKEIAADIKKFSKRLARVSAGWTVGQWEIEIVKGHVQFGYRVCTLTRNGE